MTELKIHKGENCKIFPTHAGCWEFSNSPEAGGEVTHRRASGTGAQDGGTNAAHGTSVDQHPGSQGMCLLLQSTASSELKSALARVAQWLEHCPVTERLWVQFPVRAHAGPGTDSWSG